MAIVSLVAGETIDIGDVLYVDTDGKVKLAQATSRAKSSVAGIAINPGATGDIIRVDIDGVFRGYSGMEVGTYMYVSLLNPGQLVTFAQFTADIVSVTTDGFLTNVGEVLEPETITINIEPPQAIPNPNDFLLLETSTDTQINGLLLENGSFIDLENALVTS